MSEVNQLKQAIFAGSWGGKTERARQSSTRYAATLAGLQIMF
jgi:hypothetical protein